jgi:hypothetical protein
VFTKSESTAKVSLTHLLILPPPPAVSHIIVTVIAREHNRQCGCRIQQNIVATILVAVPSDRQEQEQ